VYKWENSIYQKIANILKRAQVSPVQAFEEFDESKDGHLNKNEFYKALFDNLRI
jgi:Ca2+-binding EF-hand superfamily protein